MRIQQLPCLCQVSSRQQRGLLGVGSLSKHAKDYADLMHSSSRHASAGTQPQQQHLGAGIVGCQPYHVCCALILLYAAQNVQQICCSGMLISKSCSWSGFAVHHHSNIAVVSSLLFHLVHNSCRVRDETMKECSGSNSTMPAQPPVAKDVLQVPLRPSRHSTGIHVN